MLLSRVESFLQEGFEPSQAFAVAVSGGCDSMVLLDAVSRLIPPERLRVLHYDHATRDESALDAEFVKKETERRQLVFCGERSSQREERSEDDLRKERYGFFQKHLKENEVLLLAHHSEDQWETFIMRVLRGTGLQGLGGMSVRSGRYARPFLSFSRETLERYAKERGVSFRNDATNDETTYLRNRIRLKLSPAMKELSEEFGGWESFLARFSEMSRELKQVGNRERRLLNEAYSNFVVETAYFFRLSVKTLFGFDASARRGLIRCALQKCQAEEVSRERVKQIDRLLNDGQSRLTAPGDVLVTQSCGYLYFQSPDHLKAVSELGIIQKNRGAQCDALGFEVEWGELPTDAECRFFKNGDRRGSKKLKNLFLERQIPRPERPLVPLLENTETGEIDWIFPESTQWVKVTRSEFPFAAPHQ